MNIFCARCGAGNEGQARFCRKCGAALNAAESGGDRASSATEEDLRTVKLAGSRIIDQWLLLISGAQGRGDALTKRVQELLKEAKVPSLTLEHMEVHLGLMHRMFKGTRKFLVVDNEYLHGYRVFIGAHDYGDQLAVSWYLTLEQSFLRRLIGQSISFKALFSLFLLLGWLWRRITGNDYVLPEKMDLFDRQELSSYATTVHLASKEATNELMKEMGLNSSKVGTQTRGFLNIA
jgi:hypothetical protein